MLLTVYVLFADDIKILTTTRYVGKSYLLLIHAQPC
jgi:hypothetical protein